MQKAILTVALQLPALGINPTAEVTNPSLQVVPALNQVTTKEEQQLSRLQTLPHMGRASQQRARGPINRMQCSARIAMA